MEEILENPNANNIANFAFNTARTWFFNNDFGAQDVFISMLEGEELVYFNKFLAERSLKGGGRPRMRKRWLSNLLKGGVSEDPRHRCIAKFLHFIFMISLVIVFVIAYNNRLIDPTMCDSIFYQLGGHLFQSNLQNQYCAYYRSFRKLIASITEQTQKVRTPQELIALMPIAITPTIAVYTGIIKIAKGYDAAINELASKIGDGGEYLQRLTSRGPIGTSRDPIVECAHETPSEQTKTNPKQIVTSPSKPR